MARILVIDDEEGVRSFVAEALETEGHQVVQAANGEEGLRRLRERAFHLMITDLRMPGVDGMNSAAHRAGRAAGDGSHRADRLRHRRRRRRGHEARGVGLLAEAAERASGGPAAGGARRRALRLASARRPGAK